MNKFGQYRLRGDWKDWTATMYLTVRCRASSLGHSIAQLMRPGIGPQYNISFFYVAVYDTYIL